MNQTQSSNTKEKKKLDKVNADLKKSRKIATLSAAPAVKKVVRTAAKRKSPPKGSHLSRWADALAAPFDSQGAICPVNFNPAPSLMNTTIRMTHTGLNITVPATFTTQMTLFPGHGKPPNQLQSNTGNIVATMDGVAYHSGEYTNLVNGTPNCHVGPCSTSSSGGVPFKGFCVLYNRLAAGLCTNGAAGQAFIGDWDTPAPFGSAFVGHLRWQLVSCGVRIYNTTPQLNRGGNVVTVQLVNGNGFSAQDSTPATNQSQLETNPSFKVHGDCGDGMEISWIPRLQDLAYWHSVVRGIPSDPNTNVSDYAGAGMGIFLNNPTAVDQTYVIQTVFNFMLAGQSLQSISTPSVVEPILRAPVEQTVVHLANTSSTAKTAPFVAQAASSSPSEGRSMFEKLSTKAYEMAMHGAHAVGEGIAAHMLRPRGMGPLAPYGHGYQGQ